MNYYLNIGSNLGLPRLNISRALAAINREFGPFEISNAVESEPWGFDSPHSFVNVGVAINTSLSPVELLDRLQEIERSISKSSHRNADGSYADRIIDIDIMAADEPYHDDRLDIPHRHLAERPFFLQPLSELAPHLVPKK